MRLIPLFALTGLLSVASADSVLHLRATPTNDTAPCAAVSSAYFAPSNPAHTVPAQMAYDCIKSVPLNVTAAKRLLGELRPYINWQSNLAFLKHPPAEYVEKIQAPVDILAGLDVIERLVDSGVFTGEYDFGFALYQLIQSAHDGHFSVILESVGAIFNFGRTVPLVSVSEDGKKLPAVFAYVDVLDQQLSNNMSYTPSAVVKIDGQDVTFFLENWSQWGALQDRDALYNNVFYELAQVSLGGSGSGTGTFTGGGRGRWVFPGANTTLTFANRTSKTFENYARVLVSMNNVDSGEKLQQQQFVYAGSVNTGEVNFQAIPGVKATGSAQAAAIVAAATGSDSPPGYPPIVVAGPSNLINGYYIDSLDYSDIAVLSVPNFVGDSDYEIPFQATTQNFVAKALADGKTKLIIDLSANGGGTVMQGFDLFKQIFPSILPYGATRFRAHESVDLIGQAFSAICSQYPRVVNTIQWVIQSFQTTYFDYETDADVNYKPFTSWPQKYAPRVYNGDNFTGIARWNFSDVLITFQSGGINITGYESLANYTKQPFEADNIIIVYDGYCASTCSIFSELMRQQGGVKAYAMGGRPNTSPIQAVGGTKGVNNYDWQTIQSLAEWGIKAASSEEKDRYKNSVLSDYGDAPFFRTGSNSPGCNVRDGLREGDDSGTPLQFRYEEADCRLYYTPEMTVDATAIWKAAADAQWGKKDKWGRKGNCVREWRFKEKREVTTKLGRNRLRKRGVGDAKVMEELLKTFAIETNNQLSGDGFMKP